MSPRTSSTGPSRLRRALGWGLLLGLAVILLTAWWIMIRMPNESFTGPPPPLDARGERVKDALEEDVRALAVTIGERNMRFYDELLRAGQLVERSLADAGYEVRQQTYDVNGRPYANYEVELAGRTDAPMVVVGAHYDSALGTPGANDNGSGVAVLFALARTFAGQTPERTLRFVAFTNEEMPHFRDGTMGSQAYAQRCRARGERIEAMLSLETMGYFSDDEGSQQYPFPVGLLYPDRGNFIGFVGNVASRKLVQRVVGSFRRHGRVPSEGAALPDSMPGVGWSDHSSFWREGYPALMVTDTAPFRYPYYHHPNDTPDKIDFERLTHVALGLEGVLADLAGVEQPGHPAATE